MDTMTYLAHQKTYTVTVQRIGEKWRVLIDGEPHNVEVIQADETSLTLRFGTRIRTFYTAVDGGKRWIAFDGCTYLVEKPSGITRQKPKDDTHERRVYAPMPSQVREVFIQPGDVVEKGATLMLLEAMKMEIRIQAPRAGRVSAVFARPGEAIDLGSVLVEFEEG